MINGRAMAPGHERQEDSNCGPIDFWRGCLNYPKLKKLVTKFLPPPSYVESERVFSRRRHLYS